MVALFSLGMSAPGHCWLKGMTAAVNMLNHVVRFGGEARMVRDKLKNHFGAKLYQVLRSSDSENIVCARYSAVWWLQGYGATVVAEK